MIKYADQMKESLKCGILFYVSKRNFYLPPVAVSLLNNILENIHNVIKYYARIEVILHTLSTPCFEL